LFVFNGLSSVWFRRVLNEFIFKPSRLVRFAAAIFSAVDPKTPAWGAREKGEPVLDFILKNGNTISAGLSRKCRFFLSSRPPLSHALAAPEGSADYQRIRSE
jgi:hypothetical protein